MNVNQKMENLFEFTQNKRKKYKKAGIIIGDSVVYLYILHYWWDENWTTDWLNQLNDVEK